MIQPGDLIYTHKGILPPAIVKVVGLILIPLVVVGAIAIAIAAVYTKEWWVLLLALGFFCIGLLPILAMNSVEIWISDDQLIYRENPFNFFPAKAIPVFSVKNIQIEPHLLGHGQTSYFIQIHRLDGSKIALSHTRSRQKAEEIGQIIRDNLPGTKAFDQGKALLDEEKYFEAIRVFDHAIIENPHHAGAYLLRGLAKLRLGELQRSLTDMDASIELDDQNAAAYMQRIFLHYELGMWEKALADLERHITLMPSVQNHPKVQSLMKDLKQKIGSSH